MKADRDKVVPLIKTARGQLDGILKMIDEDRYCIDISNQVLAVISILGKANKEIIRAHLAGCVKDSLTGGTPEEVETKLDEVMSVLDKIVYIETTKPNGSPGISDEPSGFCYSKGEFLSFRENTIIQPACQLRQ